MLEGLPKYIKILTYNSYGAYGFDIPQAIIDAVEAAGGRECMEYWFENGYPDDYSGKIIRSDKHDESRTSPVLIAAFEAYCEHVKNKEYPTWKEKNAEKCKYTVNTLWMDYEVEYVDGKESSPAITYRL